MRKQQYINKHSVEMFSISKIFLFFTICTTVVCKSYTPIVIWHGLAYTCCMEHQIGMVARLLREALPGVYVLQLKIGKTEHQDYLNSFFMHPDKQIETVCKIIKEDPLLANGYNGLAFSQGSQLLRGLAQRCPEPRMKSLVTMSGQHQGVYGIPRCDPVTKPRCNNIRLLINYLVYFSIIQKILVPTSYWRNPLNKKAYISGSSYLADINNEKYINQTYIKNLQLLENFVMVKYENDKVVLPKESSWFGFYKEGQSSKVEDLHESDLYISDRLGLKQMEKDGKLHFISNNWDHSDFEWSWFKENIVDKFFK